MNAEQFFSASENAAVWLMIKPSNYLKFLNNIENGNNGINSDIVIQEKKVNLACYENFVLAFLFKAVFTKSKILF